MKDLGRPGTTSCSRENPFCFSAWELRKIVNKIREDSFPFSTSFHYGGNILIRPSEDTTLFSENG